ncbi:hypothetical protein [Streptomyces bacillaris]|uniref:hypothetical protein n=1 Tax=Streptomyces bacillaris TaxID=68179 RepID=UPI0036628E7E
MTVLDVVSWWFPLSGSGRPAVVGWAPGFTSLSEDGMSASLVQESPPVGNISRYLK